MGAFRFNKARECKQKEQKEFVLITRPPLQFMAR
jgi:hypothetical protein